MNDLINFIVKYSKWIVLGFYIVIGLILLFNNNPYQHHVYLTSAGSIASSFHEGASNITSYFHLREINEELQQHTSSLELEILGLRNKLQYYEEKYNIDSALIPTQASQFDFIQAHVIKNSTNKPYNYITINKGSNDSIKPEMGVIDHNGVVGKIDVIGKNNARVISLLNPNIKLSCCISGTQNTGSLIWDGIDPEYAILEELPRHTVYKKGDTIITSGYSSSFPYGIPVGVIVSDHKTKEGDFQRLKIKLTANFAKLSDVRVIVNYMVSELDSLEIVEKNDQK